MPLGDGVKTKVLDAIFSDFVAFLAADWTDGTDEPWIELHTGNPTSAGTANTIATSSRKQVNHAAASSNLVSSNEAASWASGEHGASTVTVTYVSVWTASTAGTCLAYAAVTNPVQVDPTQTLTLASGDLDWTAVVS